MFGCLIGRFQRSILIMLAMTMIVFVGVNVIGSPIEILVSPDASEAETLPNVDQACNATRRVPASPPFSACATRLDLGRSDPHAPSATPATILIATLKAAPGSYVHLK